MKKYGKWLVTILLVSIMMLGVVGCGGQEENNDTNSATAEPMDYQGEIKVAAQNVNETMILANMAKLLIEEYTGLEASVNVDFTGSAILHQAMTGKEVDIYPTWTGTQLHGVLRYEGPKLNSQESFEKVKQGFEENFNMTWIEPFGFNNTYTMAVKREIAEKYNLEKQSDLAGYAADWKLAGDDNFDVLPDAYPGWSKEYGIEFKEVLPMQYGVIYRAIDQGEVDVAAAYSTDARIKKLDLVMLEDDKEYFPAYNGAYVVRQGILDDYPELKNILEKISGEIDNAEMSAMNYRHDIDGDDPETIAADFLKENGFIK